MLDCKSNKQQEQKSNNKTKKLKNILLYKLAKALITSRDFKRQFLSGGRYAKAENMVISPSVHKLW